MRGTVYTGRTLAGRYGVGEQLGQGGWGAVYAGTQMDLGRKVALKILHTDVALAPEAIARFQREAKAAAAFGHPNIVQVTDFQMNPGEPPFLVMEMLTGATLGTLLKRQSCLPPNRVAQIMFQVLSALDVAHGAQIIHRDVKPDNIFLVSMPGIDDFVKLLDFGIAKLSAENQAQITDAGQMLGSPAFMSPEQVRSQNIDHRADIYAVGATMYFALAGRLPFDATSLPALLAAIMDQKPTPLSQVASGIDPRLASIVDRALHKDPQGRFQSAADMRIAIEPWVASGGAHVGIPISASTSGASGFANPHHQQTGPQTGMMTTGGGPPPTHQTHAVPPTYPAAGMAIGGMGMNTTGAPVVHSVGAALQNANVPMLHQPAPPAQNISAMQMPPSPPQNNPYMMTPYGSGVPQQAAAPAQKGSGAILGVLIAILLVLILLGGVGGAGACFYMRSAPTAATGPVATTTAVAPPGGAAVPPGSPSTTAVAVGGPGATTPTTPGGPAKAAGPQPTANNNSLVSTTDAGGGAKAATAVDAGAPVAAKKQMGGVSTLRISGGSFGKFELDKGKAAVNAVMPQLSGCFAATEFDPPDHQFSCWNFVIDSNGNVSSVRKGGEEAHPKLDGCVVGVLRTTKWDKIPGGGTPQVCLSARTRDNP